MVKISNQYVLSLLLILISYSALAVPQLKVYTNKVETELGRPLRVELIGIDLKEKISELNLRSLNKHFGVVADYFVADASDPRWPNNTVQILNLKLYPRKTGLLTIPALRINRIQSKPINIKSYKGKTSIPKVSLSADAPYIRQQIIATINLTSTVPTSRLSVSKDENIKGFESQPLTFKRTKRKDGRYLLQIGWAITALKSGTQALQLPPVEYSISGVSRKRFFLPSTILKIKPIPTYLPPTIPVGKISIQSQLKQRYFLSTDAIYYWKLTLEGQLNNSYRLPPVLRQIKNNRKMKFLPVNSQRSVNTTNKTLTSRVSHSIPFKATASGELSFPQIRLQYFDPGSGTIKSVIHQAGNIFVLSLFWKIATSILTLLFLAWLFVQARKKWQRVQFTKLKYQQAITLLTEEENAQAIRASLKLIAEAEYWNTNMTITQWCQLWRGKYKTDSNFNLSCAELSSSCYQLQSNNVSIDASKKFLNLIKNKVKL